METLTQKMFTCPACGPVETCHIQGDWVNKTDYVDMVFELIRPDFVTFEARVSERSARKPDGLSAPRILADVEIWAEEQRKFQCSSCGKVFVIPKKATDSGNVSGGAAAIGAPGNQPMNNPFMPQPFAGPSGNSYTGTPIYTIMDALSEADLDTILQELGENPSNYNIKDEKLDGIIDRMM
jgi:predicted RNA-binding Zn-ribbon protein involved in translation (DUF1610 family)